MTERQPTLQDLYAALPTVQPAHVLNVYLFGSRVWGTAEPGSDWYALTMAGWLGTLVYQALLQYFPRDFMVILSNESQYSGSNMLENKELNMNMDVFTEYFSLLRLRS